MEEIEKELEEVPSEPTEADLAEEASKAITEELEAVEEKKEEIKEEKVEEPVPEPKPKSTIDLTKLNAFKEKAIKEFGLTEHIDSHGCSGLYYNDFIILKLLPRKNCWYGVWREIPEQGNKWRAVRVHNQEEENVVYEHIKLFIETNKE